MNLWKRIACNAEVKRSMMDYYDEKGMADVRIYLGSWIEERIIPECINPSLADSYECVAQKFYEDLKQKLIPLSNDNLMKFKLAEICTSVAQTPAMEIYTHMRNGLQREIQLLDQVSQYQYMGGGGGGNNIVGNGMGGLNGVVGSGGGGDGNSGNITCNSGAVLPGMHSGGMGSVVTGNGAGGGGGQYMGDALYTAHSLIPTLTLNISRLIPEIQQFCTTYKQFHVHFTNYTQRKILMSQQDVQSTDLHLQNQCSILAETRNKIIHELRRIIGDYDLVQETVINELKNWQHNQALAGNGAPFRDNLDDIQRCIELLVEMVGKIIEVLNELQKLSSDNNDDISEMISHVSNAQQLLVLSSFIVEKQPPQVMKTNTRFAAAVRWLIGPQLGISANNPTVECIILSESQAQRHTAQRTMSDSSPGTPASSGEIVNNIGTMEYNSQSRILSASFRTMQLKKIKRAEKKGTESVMDEKFALLFYTSITVNNYRIRVWTLSLPVVVIVHGNQEPQSWATITWDNAFSDIVREPFQVPERVAWSQLALALNTKFESSTGRALTEDNLTFIYEKLFRHSGLAGDHKDYITWAQFCKEPLPDRSFTFWDWFFAIMKLTKDHLLSLWKAGLIVGFINKRKAEELLRVSTMGTFLLRFSDSELGGITVGVVTEQNSVLMLSPWTARDLNIRCLADRIHDLDILRFVYPTHRARDDAFGDFYTQRMDETTRRDGYVTNTIRAHVPAIENTQHHQIHSPHPQDMQMVGNENFNISDLESILY